MTWRDAARPIVAAALASVDVRDEKAVRRALRDAYPFGERRMHPYKVWLDECRRQVAFQRALAQRRGLAVARRLTDPPPADPAQMVLFDNAA